MPAELRDALVSREMNSPAMLMSYTCGGSEELAPSTAPKPQLAGLKEKRRDPAHGLLEVRSSCVSSSLPVVSPPLLSSVKCPASCIPDSVVVDASVTSFLEQIADGSGPVDALVLVDVSVPGCAGTWMDEFVPSVCVALATRKEGRFLCEIMACPST